MLGCRASRDVKEKGEAGNISSIRESHLNWFPHKGATTVLKQYDECNEL